MESMGTVLERPKIEWGVWGGAGTLLGAGSYLASDSHCVPAVSAIADFGEDDSACVANCDEVQLDAFIGCSDRLCEVFRGLAPHDTVRVTVSSALLGLREVELSAQSAVLRLLPHFIADTFSGNGFPLLEVSFFVSDGPFSREGWLINELRSYYISYYVYSGLGKDDVECALAKVYDAKLEFIWQIFLYSKARGGEDMLAVLNGLSVAIMSLQSMLSGKVEDYCKSHFSVL